jgi:hypothetical protein
VNIRDENGEGSHGSWVVFQNGKRHGSVELVTAVEFDDRGMRRRSECCHSCCGDCGVGAM